MQLDEALSNLRLADFKADLTAGEAHPGPAAKAALMVSVGVAILATRAKLPEGLSLAPDPSFAQIDKLVVRSQAGDLALMHLNWSGFPSSVHIQMDSARSKDLREVLTAKLDAGIRDGKPDLGWSTRGKFHTRAELAELILTLLLSRAAEELNEQSRKLFG